MDSLTANLRFCENIYNYFINLPMKMEPIRSYETSDTKNQTPENHPKKNSLQYFIHLPMKMEPTRSSETSAIKTQTPGNYPKRNILQCIFKFLPYIPCHPILHPCCTERSPFSAFAWESSIQGQPKRSHHKAVEGAKPVNLKHKTHLTMKFQRMRSLHKQQQQQHSSCLLNVPGCW